jgi:hypothetical protein
MWCKRAVIGFLPHTGLHWLRRLCEAIGRPHIFDPHLLDRRAPLSPHCNDLGRGWAVSKYRDIVRHVEAVRRPSGHLANGMGGARYALTRWRDYCLASGWAGPVEYFLPPFGRGSLLQGWSGMPGSVALRYGLDAINLPSSPAPATP